MYRMLDGYVTLSMGLFMYRWKNRKMSMIQMNNNMLDEMQRNIPTILFYGLLYIMSQY